MVSSPLALGENIPIFFGKNWTFTENVVEYIHAQQPNIYRSL